jgi:ABC-2 type transport system permease protein
VHLLGLAVLIGYAVAGTLYALRVVHSLHDERVMASVIVVGGTMVTLCYLLIPLFFGADDPADPRATIPAGVPARRVAVGLAASAPLSVPAVLLAMLAVGQAIAWDDDPDAAAFAVLAAALIFVTGVLAARLTRSVAAFWLHGRRARETIGLIVATALLVSTPGIIGIALTDWTSDEAREHLEGVATTLGQTPMGAAWAVPALASGGDAGAAWSSVLYALLFIVVLWVAWQLLVMRMLVTPQLPDAAVRRTKLGWFALLPATPTGAVAARSLSYWMRDGRYRLSLLAVPVVPLLLIPPLLVAGVWWQNLALIPLPVMCLFLGWMIHNDTSADNTAIWLHVAAEVPGYADRIGRTVPPLLLGVPLLLVGAPLTANLYGVPDVLPSVVGVSACLLLAGLGISSAVSARFPYPTVRPGDSPFAQPQSTTSSPGQALSFLGTIVVTTPAMVLAGLGLALGGDWHMMSLLAGLTVGAGVYYLGVSAGARTFSRNAPELLAFSLRN